MARYLRIKYRESRFWIFGILSLDVSASCVGTRSECDEPRLDAVSKGEAVEIPVLDLYCFTFRR